LVLATGPGCAGGLGSVVDLVSLRGTATLAGMGRCR